MGRDVRPLATPTARYAKPPVPRAPPGIVEPINRSKARAHYVGPRLGKVLSWGILFLCMAIGIVFYRSILGAAEWVHLEASERGYADLGQDVCLMPLLAAPEYTCTDCFDTEQDLLIQRYEAQARGFNEWRAERCLPLM